MARVWDGVNGGCRIRPLYLGFRIVSASFFRLEIVAERLSDRRRASVGGLRFQTKSLESMKRLGVEIWPGVRPADAGGGAGGCIGECRRRGRLAVPGHLSQRRPIRARGDIFRAAARTPHPAADLRDGEGRAEFGDETRG